MYSAPSRAVTVASVLGGYFNNFFSACRRSLKGLCPSSWKPSMRSQAPKDWKPLPEPLTEWFSKAAGQPREKVPIREIREAARRKQIDIMAKGEGIGRTIYWRQHVPTLFD